MGGLTSQTFALVLVLIPGFVFFAGAYLAPNPYVTRFSMKHGIVLDTAIFVVTSVALHGSVGLLLLIVLDRIMACSVVATAARLVSSIDAVPVADRCVLWQDITVSLLYLVVVSVSAFAAGWWAMKAVAQWPRAFIALNGPYYDVVRGESLVIANVMTRTAHEGRTLVYEGVLIELALTSSKSINYVCLEGARRFYLSLAKGGARTTVRHQFLSIDKNATRVSRITIPGDQIANLVTRVYPTRGGVSPVVADPIKLTRRAVMQVKRWLRRV